MRTSFSIPAWVQQSSLVRNLQSHKMVVALVVVLWLFLYFSSVSKTYFYYVRHEIEIELGYIFLRALLIWGIPAFFAPLFAVVAQKFPLDSSWNKLHMLIHAIISMLFVPLHAALFRVGMMAWYAQVSWSWESLVSAVPSIIMGIIIITPLTYWVIIGAYYMKKYYEQYQHRELQNARLEAELASIQLHVLKIQLHPHFLFNTLHSINSLIYEDPKQAGEVLDLLKKMLQTSIDFADTQEVKLRQELEFTKTYLDIEKIRFQEDLEIEIDIDDQALDCYVPNLILQPLVENSVKHGVSRTSGMGKIRIGGRLTARYLVLEVEDNGPGLDVKAENLRMGIGLRNNIQRLDHLYNNYHFNIGASALGGTKVQVRIPIQVQ